MPIGVNLRLKPLRNMGFMPSLDPPKSPLRRGTLTALLSPPS